MGAKLRVVRRRIKSVQSTMKITRAMELIAASRILKAQQRVGDRAGLAGYIFHGCGELDGVGPGLLDALLGLQDAGCSDELHGARDLHR